MIVSIVGHASLVHSNATKSLFTQHPVCIIKQYSDADSLTKWHITYQCFLMHYFNLHCQRGGGALLAVLEVIESQPTAMLPKTRFIAVFHRFKQILKIINAPN